MSVPLLEGLEKDDLSRWPGGIFRRSFARSYATAIGLDADLVVKRIEEEHPDPTREPAPVAQDAPPAPEKNTSRALQVSRPSVAPAMSDRFKGVALDLLVAVAIAFGFAAGGSSLLWPVIAIAAYHALGVLLTGTTPMLAIVASERQARVSTSASAAPPAQDPPVRRAEPQQTRRHRGRRPPNRVEARLDRH